MAAQIVMNLQGMRGLLVHPTVAADLLRRGNAIAAAADGAANDPGGHRVISETGEHRARVAVVTATPKAMWKEATQRSLSSALGAGRG